MRDEILAFLKRANELGDVVADLCDTGEKSTGIVRSFEPGEIQNPETCADTILDAVKSDAIGRSGKVRYELVGVRGGKRWGRQAILIDAGGGASFGAEDASMAGIVVECIRDKRDLMRMSIAHTDNIMARMQTMLDMQAKQLIAVEEQRVEIFRVLEDLTQNRHARDLANKAQEADQKTTSRLVEDLVPLFPALVNRLAGKRTGDPLTMAPEMVASLLGSLDEGQIEKIASALHPMQAAAFFEFMQAAAAAKESHDRKQLAAANGATTTQGGAG